MKTLALSTTALAVVASLAAANQAASTITDSNTVPKLPEKLSTPTGFTFVGQPERLAAPPTNNDQDSHKEQFWPGLWGGFGPYRYPFTYAGLAGFAYPLGYWNLYGAALYGGGCGFGFPYGGLFYC